MSTLPTTDRIATYCRGTTLGNPAAVHGGKQINYDPTRAADGSLTQRCRPSPTLMAWSGASSLTAGVRTDTGATNGAAFDTTASASLRRSGLSEVFSLHRH